MITLLLLSAVVLYLSVPLLLAQLFTLVGPTIPKQKKQPTIHLLRVDRFQPNGDAVLTLNIALPLPNRVPLPTWFSAGLSGIRSVALFAGRDQLVVLSLHNDISIQGGSECISIEQNAMVLSVPNSAALAQFVRTAKLQKRTSEKLDGLDLTLVIEADVHICGHAVWRGITLKTVISVSDIILTGQSEKDSHSSSNEATEDVANDGSAKNADWIRPSGGAGILPEPKLEVIPATFLPGTGIQSGFSLTFSQPPSLHLSVQRVELQVLLNGKHAASVSASEFSIRADTLEPAIISVDVKPRIGGLMTGVAAALKGSRFQRNNEPREAPLGILKGFFAVAANLLSSDDSSDSSAPAMSSVHICGVRLYGFGENRSVVKIDWLEDLMDALDIKFDVDHDELLKRTRKSSEDLNSGEPFERTRSVRREPSFTKEQVVGSAVNSLAFVVGKLDKAGVVKDAIRNHLNMDCDRDGKRAADFQEPPSGSRSALVGLMVGGISKIVRTVDKEGVVKRAVTEAIRKKDI
ncbi:hypothetical protein HDU78_002506 [Chytriomyces hyalinus]|nr:hypothetical protein HDU78_002506 [Chytriomyces hyalinus]